MKKTIIIFLTFVLYLSLCACGSNIADEACIHNYYLSDYCEATSSSNGYKKYTCSNCEHTYQEVLPMREESAASDTKEAGEVDLTRQRTANLFDLPVYSNKNVLTGAVDSLKYCSERTDVEGWKHTNCYEICGGTDERWIRYELNGKYTTIIGELYDANNSGGAGWLEFYDGEDFLAATPRIDENSSSVEFEIDITGVEYLTVRLCATKAGTWMIADDIILTN